MSISVVYNRIATSSPQLAAYLMLLGMIVVWSFNWIVIKVAVQHMSPLWFTALRFVGAAVLTSLLCIWLAQPLIPAAPKETRRLAMVGLFSVAGNLGCLAIGLQFAEAGRGSVLAYTMQMWAIPLGFLINGDRVPGAKIVLGVVAFAGVVLLLNPLNIGATGGQNAIGYFVLAGAAFNWAVGSCIYRKYEWSAPFWTQINVQLWTSAAFIAACVAIFEKHEVPALETPVLAGLAYNWILGTGLCYWWWSRVLRVMSAAQGGLILCAIPVLAIAFAGAIFGERLGWLDAFGVGLVLLGIVGAMVFDLWGSAGVRHSGK